MIESKLKLFSMGIAAQDKEMDKFELEVYPMEIYPNVEGSLTETESINVDNIDVNEENTNVIINKSYTITAKWFKRGDSNRATPPDVTKGMEVVLYNYAGTDEYFWELSRREEDLFKRERVIYYYSNKEKASEEDLLNKGYSLTIDTYNKFVRFHTTNNDEEKAAYDIQLDTGEGQFLIQDSNENKILLDSDKKDFGIKIGNDTMFKTGNDLKINVENNIEVEGKKYKLSNGSDELISLLCDLLDTIMDEKHIGNQGATTMMEPGTKAKFRQLKSKIEQFKL